MTAIRSSNSTEDRVLNRISRNLSCRNNGIDESIVGYTPSPRAPTITVWRSGQALPMPEATAPVVAKLRIRPATNATVIVAKADPAIAAEARRMAENAAILLRSEQLRRESINAELDRQAEERRVRRIAAETKQAERDAFVAAERARLERERAERDEAERLENERREAARIQAAADEAAAEAERKKGASPESISVLVAAKGTPKAKVETPKPPVATTSRKPGQGISLQALRAMSAAPLQPAPRPSKAEIARQIGVAKNDSAGKRSKDYYKPSVEKPKPIFAPSAIPVFGSVPTDLVALNKRIAALDPGIVTNIYRGAVIKFRWATTDEMINANTDDGDTLTGLRSFVERCEKATVKAARKGK